MTLTDGPLLSLERVQPRSPRRRTARLAAAVSVLAVAVVVVLVLLVASMHRTTTGRATRLMFDRFGITSRSPGTGGPPMMIDSTLNPQFVTPHHRLDVRAIKPEITVNTANATVRVLECNLRGSNIGVGFETEAHGRDMCFRGLRPFRPGALDLRFGRIEIVYVVTPRSPGTIAVRGATITYVDGATVTETRAGTGFVMGGSAHS